MIFHKKETEKSELVARPGYASRCVNLGNAVEFSSVYWIVPNKIHHQDQQQSETQNYSLHLEFNSMCLNFLRLVGWLLS